MSLVESKMQKTNGHEADYLVIIEELRRSEARYRGIIEDQVELIRRFTPDGTLTFVNGAFCRYFGKKEEELLGEKFTSLIPLEDGEVAWKIILALSPENPVAISEPRVIRDNEIVHWLQWTNRAIFDDEKNIVEYQSVGRDITAQKEGEVKILEAREVMARATKVNTLAVIGGGIAHEINQPLNAIRVLAETVLLLLESRESLPVDEVVKSVTNISRQVDRIDLIVNHLRSLLHTNQKNDHVACDVNEIVEKTILLIANQLIARNIHVKKNMMIDLPTIYGCSIHFEEIILNLLMNAMQALEVTKQEYKEIYIQTGVDKKERVSISIGDNGLGIDKQVKDKIFEPFFSTKVGDSMGLGLAIVHSIVMSSNGEIEVVDNVPQGAIFTVTFPGWKEGEYANFTRG